MNPTLPVNNNIKGRIIPYEPLEDFYYEISLQEMLSVIDGNLTANSKAIVSKQRQYRMIEKILLQYALCWIYQHKN